MFTSIIVPLDLAGDDDRALAYVKRLVDASPLPVELVTVSSPGIAEYADQYELRRCARGLARATTIVLHSDDAGAAIVAHSAEQPDALLAMVTHARGTFSERLFGSVAEAILTHHRGPVLLFGPQGRGQLVDRPQLVLAVDEAPTAEAVLTATAAWTGTFGGPAPWVVGVVEKPTSVPAGNDVLPEAGHVHHVVEQLRERSVDARWELLHGHHPAELLVDFAGRQPDAVLVVASEHWTDPQHRHRASIARSIVHRSRHPVLVVPSARPNGR